MRRSLSQVAEHGGTRVVLERGLDQVRCLAEPRLIVARHHLHIQERAKRARCVENAGIRFFLTFPEDWEEGIPDGLAQRADKLPAICIFRVMTGDLVLVPTYSCVKVQLEAALMHDMTTPRQTGARRGSWQKESPFQWFDVQP